MLKSFAKPYAQTDTTCSKLLETEDSLYVYVCVCVCVCVCLCNMQHHPLGTECTATIFI